MSDEVVLPLLEVHRTPPWHPEAAHAPGDDDLRALGGRLRQLRRARRLSLSEVSGGTRISASMLSQLERGTVGPSLATLHTLAQFYETRLFELFQDPGALAQGVLVRKADRPVVHLPRSNATYELISGMRQELQLVEMAVTAEQGSADHTLSHAGEECVLVLAGAVRATLGDEQFDLDPGDSLQYPATIPHSYETRTGERARLIIAMTPPTF
jgi:transcriptional regulator with XRE-family HTH domain